MQTEIQQRDQLPGIPASAWRGSVAQRHLIAEKALGYVGTPWHHQGRLKGVGIDCVGLLALAGSEAGAAIEDVSNYPPQFAGSWLTDELSKYCERLEKSGPYEVGDVLVFAFAEGYWHVAIVTQVGAVAGFNARTINQIAAVNPGALPERMGERDVKRLEIVHAYSGVGKCVNGPVSQAWLRRLHSAWRVRG